MAVAKLKKTPLVQWVESAMLHSSMSQSDLARALQSRLRTDFDRSKVYKIIKGERKVSAEEMLAVEEVTGFAAPAALRVTPSQPDRKGAAKLTQVPLLGDVTAGKFATPVSQLSPEQVPLLAFADLGRGDFFALQVEKEGDSMDRISPAGSIIVVNRADKTLVAGKYYVFSLKGETTYKMWPGGEHKYLAPFSTNPANKPIFFKRKSDLEVVGRVKRTVLDL